MDIFRVFDSLNDLANMKAAMEAVQSTHAICEAAICYTGDILDPARTSIRSSTTSRSRRSFRRWARTFSPSKTWLAFAARTPAQALVKALKDELRIPVHFHTHDTSGINAGSVLRASDAGVDVVDLAIASMSGSTSQPNLNSIVAACSARRAIPASTSIRSTSSATTGSMSALSTPLRHGAEIRQRRGLSARDARRPIHEPQGAGRLDGPRRALAGDRALYAEVNQLFGDIVKVTPISKVVGDMALFLFTRGIKPADVVNLDPAAWAIPRV
jgi:pyruvate carboxylase